MDNIKNQKSKLPYIIIGLVLIFVLAAVAIGTGLFGAGWWAYNTTKSANLSRAGNSATPQKTPSMPVNAPAGAIPPNSSGSPTASVTVEEFADFQCPTCASTHPVMSEIKAFYGSRIRFIYRNFPLQIPAHDKSYDASVAAEAAGMQGKFWDMQNLLFANQQAWTAAPTYKQIWNEYAQKIGLDVAKFQTDMAGIAAKSRVDEDLKRGRGLNVNSTPTIYVNGVSVDAKDFNVGGMKTIIDGELQKASAPMVNTANTNK